MLEKYNALTNQQSFNQLLEYTNDNFNYYNSAGFAENRFNQR